MTVDPRQAQMQQMIEARFPPAHLHTFKSLHQRLSVREGVWSLPQRQRPAVSSWPAARLWPARVTGLRGGSAG